MAEIGKNQQAVQGATQDDEMVLMLDGIYNEIIRNLNKIKDELLSEVKYTSLQAQSVKKDISDSLDEQKSAVQAIVRELKYGYQQNQAIHNDLSSVLSDEVVVKLNAVESKMELLESVEKMLAELNAKLTDMDMDAIAESIREKVVESLPAYDEIDYDKIGEVVAEKTEASVAEHSRQLSEAIAAIPVAENVDYTRIVEEVGDRMLELLQETNAVNAANAASASGFASSTGDDEDPAPATPVAVEIDYERIVYETAEKVIESLPPVEKIDYQRIADIFAAKAAQPVEIDYDLLAEKLAAKMPAAQPAEIDYDLLAEKVAEKVSANNTVMMGAAIDEDEAQEENTEVYIDSDGVRQIADGVAENLDIDTLAQKISEKLQVTVTVDYDKIGAVVEDKLSAVQPVAVCETVEAAQEEVVEEPIVEEVQEEATEELAVAETPQEETVEETPVVPVLVEADADMVIRLKKSFTAKLSQSEENVKVYYSAIKNGLTEYKKINSNISWHGDRFNYGRDTIAKINICGKTLGLYLALDPNDPEFKTTVYHQKDVGKQKAYESTPFMVKIRSEAGMKKALRLVTALAEKLGAQKQNGFVPTDYVAMFPNASDEQLLADGLIKATKEKKVALDF